MPFFAPAPPPHHADKTKPAVRAKVPQSKTSQKIVRTNLPMTGGSAKGGQTGGAGQTLGSGTNTTGPTGSTEAVQGGVKMLLPTDAQSSGKVNIAQAGSKGAGSGKKLKFVTETYFDAGAQDLVGSFTTQVLRYGVRYEQHEIHLYAKNETLNTEGTNLPFQSIVTGFSMGVGYRYWFPGNHFFATVSTGKYLSGPNKNKTDFRVGAAGYWGGRNPDSDKFQDIYADAFYIDIAKDVFLSGRMRSGLVLLKNGDQGYGVGYGVAQVFASGKGTNGTENRVEVGFGIGYVYRQKIALNVELRGGYAFRGIINNRTYLNPMIVLSGGL